MEPDGNELEVIARARRLTGLAIPLPTAATYDTTTEGKTGWRFVLTRRWIAFVVGLIVYAAGCAAGVIWQAQLGEQIAQFNATVSRNFDATPVPLGDVLPAIGTHTASTEWKPVTASGTYMPAKQLYVRNRTCGSDTGFEVLTPLRMSDGAVFVVDRGCVASSSANPNDPSPVAPPPTGTVAVTARVVAGESAQGSVTASEAAEPSEANQIDSIDLRQIAKRMGAPTYTGAYGMLVSQSPAPARSLHRVLSGRPTVDGSAQEGTIFATALYALVGLIIFGYALREKFRFVNRFDPRLWQREWRRVQRLARKKYTDAEIEDMQIAGVVPSGSRPAGDSAWQDDTAALDVGAPAPDTDSASTGPVIIGPTVDWRTTRTKH